MTVKSHASENYKQHFSAAYEFSLRARTHTHTHTHTPAASQPARPSLSNIPDCVSVMSVSIHVCAERCTRGCL